ncbi:MAG: carboxypeptidase-like regulatory domain-containing protein [Bacteroidales bacterium]|nr:carboxypeptidase-like regulatory domain-containing protein [Bacteroidales bacterium]
MRSSSAITIVLFFGIMLHSSYNGIAQQAFCIQGTVTDSATNSPVEMAVVVISELNKWTYTDSKGAFVLKNIVPGAYTLRIQCMGYKTVAIVCNFSVDIFKEILMQAESLQLKEVIVTATEKQNGPTASVIDQQAMKHIQPSGFADLLELLPGHITQKISMSVITDISIRQAGSDDNTPVGTAYFIDGLPLSNDASLQYASNSSSELKIGDRVNIANGIDMRQVSTDDIEKIEIVRGVPSVRHGDLSAGAVLITRKWGHTPVNIRIKSDQYNKLFSAGKGFKLKNDKGIINTAAELLLYTEDPRNPLEKYTRSTSSIKYFRQLDFNNTKLIIKTGGSYIFTLDKEKTDPELNYGLKDYYRSDYSRYTFDLNADLQMPGLSSPVLSVSFSSNYAKDLLKREKHVMPNGPMPQPISMCEGESNAVYLDNGYESWLKVDGKPLNLFSRISFSMSIPIKKIIRNNLSMGIEWKYDKNFGKGEQYDLIRPMFPGTSGSRPRSFSSIPAMQKTFAYLENEIRLKLSTHLLIIQPGIRFSMLPGLASEFTMQNKVFPDPRINISWILPTLTISQNTPLQVTIHAAHGKLSRLPVLAHVYPALRYYDIIELNYYSQNSNLRRLYTLTKIIDPTNYELNPAINIKNEFGITLSINKVKIALTGFEEKMDNGFHTTPQYFPVTYKDFDESSVSSINLTSPPDLSLFTYTEKTELFAYSQYVNSSSIIKKGIEYQLNFPKIIGLNTRFVITGAWFKTRYHISIPEYYKPSYILNGEPFPYVGVYEYSGSTSRVMEILNTNIQASINIPEYKLLFSATTQIVWFEKTRYLFFKGYPNGYLDNYGIYRTFNETDANDTMLRFLVLDYSENYFKTSKTPVDAGLNLKLSKEIGKILRLSFYVNSILNYLPDYKSKYNVTITRKRQPYFGMELNFSL